MKLRWLDPLREHMRRVNERLAVLCRDFNICHTALNAHNESGFEGSIFHTDEERQCIAALTDDGWSDVYRNHHPDSQAYSWWDYRAGAFQRNHWLRIDFILATEAVAQRLEFVTIDRNFRKKKEELTASDHAPVIAQLRDA